ncbi:hypothetical protein BD410DRAFT_807581 [Rickenella mellea]|uniref:SAM domain-containing protein n=1 Tax=Rickenella mellea TaxID=50990 RepID=A0A4Y7PNV4_9AGAM|nr:hypothetical protein BD410DRAFT_807581 [Rickenella mellea]
MQLWWCSSRLALVNYSITIVTATTDVDELSLGYFLLPGGASAKVPSKALPKVLDDDETTEDLLTEIREYVKEQNAKNKGKGPSSGYVTKVVVRLVDLRKSSDGASSKDKKKKELPRTQTAASETITEEIWSRRIIDRHLCAKHGVADYIKPDGTHVSFSNHDIHSWAMLLAKNQAQLDRPPESLKLLDRRDPRNSVKNEEIKTETPSQTSSSTQNLTESTAAAAAAAAAAASTVPPWASAFMMAAQMPLLQIAAQQQFAGLAAPGFALGSDRQLPRHPFASHGLELNPTESPVRRPNAPLPTLKHWLADLDADPIRGVDNENYGQWVELFEELGFIRLDDLATTGPAQLLEMAKDAGVRMTPGTAGRLIRFANDDMKQIVRRTRQT